MFVSNEGYGTLEMFECPLCQLAHLQSYQNTERDLCNEDMVADLGGFSYKQNVVGSLNEY